MKSFSDVFHNDEREDYGFFRHTISPWSVLHNLDVLFVDESETKRRAQEFGLTEDPLRKGVWIGDNVQIDPSVTIIGSCFIGSGTIVRSSALIRGPAVIGESCVIGHGCEVKRSLIRTGATIAHWNYIGDSLIGKSVLFGSGATTANMRLFSGEVVADDLAGGPITHPKLGSLIGDNVKIGCNTILNPGCIIGSHAVIYPLMSIRGIIERECVIKGGEFPNYIISVLH